MRQILPNVTGYGQRTGEMLLKGVTGSNAGNFSSFAGEFPAVGSLGRHAETRVGTPLI